MILPANNGRPKKGDMVFCVRILISFSWRLAFQCFVFLTNQTCKLLLTYLNERLAKGENLTPESPLIAPDELRGNHKMKFLPSHRVSKLVREVFRSLGIKSRPYVLRSFYDMQLLQAQNKLGLNRDFRVFWMAHKGDIEHRYTLNKCTLQDELIEQMKEQFKKCEEFLDLDEGRRSTA